MLADTKAYSGFAVDDLQQAREFYGETLGLRTSVVDEELGLLMLHLAGDRDTLVYLKPDYTPATYTILNFPVDDVEKAVDELAARGVFHLALGGGESALLPWLGDVARHARQQGLVPNLTTSGLYGDEELARLCEWAPLFGP